MWRPEQAKKHKLAVDSFYFATAAGRTRPARCSIMVVRDAGYHSLMMLSHVLSN